MRSKTSVLPYSPESLSTVEDSLRNSSTSGNPLFYEIEVDKIIVIPRTQDVEQFEQVGEFIGANTRELIVYVYQGKSYHRDRYVFYTREKPRLENDSLNGVESPGEEKENPVEIAKEEKHKRKKLKKAHKKLLTYAEELESKVNELETRRLTLGSLISAGLDGLVRANTKIIRQFGMGGETLAGLIDADTQARNEQTPTDQPQEGSQNEGGAHFERSTENVVETTQEEKELLKVVRSIHEGFEEKQHKEIYGILNFMSKNPDSISSVLRFMHKLETSMKAKNSPSENA